MHVSKGFSGADGKQTMLANKKGRLTLRGCSKCGTDLVLENVYVIDNLETNLFSAPRIAEMGKVQLAKDDLLWIYDKTEDNLIPRVGFKLQNGHYELQVGDCEPGKCKKKLKVCEGNCSTGKTQFLNFMT